MLETASENYFGTPDKPLEASEKAEVPVKEAGQKKNFYGLNVRAHQLINKKYDLDKVTFEGGQEIFIIQSISASFDRILRRIPREVNKYSDDYEVPLGKSNIEAIVSLYGLSFGTIYNDEKWLDLIQGYNLKKTYGNAKAVQKFLKASAILKTMVMSNERVDTKNPITFIERVQEISDLKIVENFIKMTK